MTGLASIEANGLDAWVQELSGRDLPVLSQSVQRICRLTEEAATSAGDLAAAVLQDAAMTSDVLKVANSAFYNTTGRRIGTISRAVVLLGFRSVRSICVSLAVLDTLLTSGRHVRVAVLLRQSLAAAVMARNLARRFRVVNAEDVFIATLLRNLGELAFWCYAGPRPAAAMETAMDAGRPVAVAQREVVGFTFRELATRLAGEWALSELLQRTLENKGAEEPQVQVVELGHQLEAAVRRTGWRGQGTQSPLQVLAEHIKADNAELQQLLTTLRDEVEQALRAFGLHDVQPVESREQPQREREREATIRIHHPAPMVQLQVLRELSAVAREEPDCALVLEMALEGVVRGVGMDRAVLTLKRATDKRPITYALGDDDKLMSKLLTQELVFRRHPLVQHLQAKPRPLWCEGVSAAEAARLRLADLTDGGVVADFFIAPVVLGECGHGLLYADRAASKRFLDHDSFEAFCMFADQAGLALARCRD